MRQLSLLGQWVDAERKNVPLRDMIKIVHVSWGTMGALRWLGQGVPNDRALMRVAEYVGRSLVEVRWAMAMPAESEPQEEVRRPGEVEAVCYPVVTWVGIKFEPTVRDAEPARGCAGCPHLERCGAMVDGGEGFALCEALMEYDLLPDGARERVAENVADFA